MKGLLNLFCSCSPSVLQRSGDYKAIAGANYEGRTARRIKGDTACQPPERSQLCAAACLPRVSAAAHIASVLSRQNMTQIPVEFPVES